METSTELYPKWKIEEWDEYQNLKREQEKRFKKAKEDYDNFPFEARESLLDGVPATKREEVIEQAKMEVIGLEMQKAREELVKINSPFRQKDVDTLKVNYRNFYRQLLECKTKLSLLEKGTEIEENGKKIEKKDLFFPIDKLSSELLLMEQEMELYGLNKQTTLTD